MGREVVGHSVAQVARACLVDVILKLDFLFETEEAIPEDALGRFVKMVESVINGDAHSVWSLDVLTAAFHPQVEKRREAALRQCYRFDEVEGKAWIDADDYPHTYQ